MTQVRELKLFKNQDLYTHVDFKLHVKAGEGSNQITIDSAKKYTKPTVVNF